jgi:hypothetical protein
MKETERELNFCFPYDSYQSIIPFFQSTVFPKSIIPTSTNDIEDYYLSKYLRIRKKNNKYTLTRKTGDKAFTRIEESEEINETTFNLLKNENLMMVSKKRESFKVLDTPDIKFDIDIIEKPFKVCMVEIEFKNEVDFNSTLNLCTLNLGTQLKLRRNVKNAWDYFHKKIGIAGPPSSGKSTLCRQLVNTLSVDYNAEIEQVTEYARAHIARYGVPSWIIQPLIEWGQVRREQDSQNAIMTVTDSPTFLPYFYALFNFKEKLTDTSIFILGQMHKGAMYAATRYTDILLLTPKNVKSDGIRVQTNDDSLMLFHLIEIFLTQLNIPFLKVDYTVDVDILLANIFNLNNIEGEVL